MEWPGPARIMSISGRVMCAMARPRAHHEHQRACRACNGQARAHHEHQLSFFLSCNGQPKLQHRDATRTQDYWKKFHTVRFAIGKARHPSSETKASSFRVCCHCLVCSIVREILSSNLEEQSCGLSLLGCCSSAWMEGAGLKSFVVSPASCRRIHQCGSISFMWAFPFERPSLAQFILCEGRESKELKEHTVQRTSLIPSRPETVYTSMALAG